MTVPRIQSSIPVSSEVRLAHSVPAVWLDRLLAFAVDLPVADGEDAVVSTLVQTLAAMFGEVAVGASYPDGTDDARVFRVFPMGQEPRGKGMSASRLFPGYAFERTFAVPGSTAVLHVAGAHEDLVQEEAPISALTERAALVLGHGLTLARAYADARRDSQNLRVVTTQLVQAEKLASLGQLAAGIVHELNNPLTSIIAYADVMARRLESVGASADDIERAHRINDSAGRMLRFTRELVAYARPTAEPARPVDIHGVIDQAVSFCEHVVDRVGATIERRYGTGVPMVRGKEAELAQVFVNLVTNASDAIRDGGTAAGRIVVTTSPTVLGDGVVIAIEDNGPGISTEHLSQVFVPFFTTKPDGKGTGLGLSIVRNIVENHDGSIVAEQVRADSAAIHEPTDARTGDDLVGARFVIRLPSVT
jgi:signal transduction histidine kinase